MRDVGREKKRAERWEKKKRKEAKQSKMSPVCYMPTTKTVVAYSIIPTMRYAGFSRSWR